MIPVTAPRGWYDPPADDLPHHDLCPQNIEGENYDEEQRCRCEWLEDAEAGNVGDDLFDEMRDRGLV